VGYLLQLDSKTSQFVIHTVTLHPDPMIRTTIYVTNGGTKLGDDAKDAAQAWTDKLLSIAKTTRSNTVAPAAVVVYVEGVDVNMTNW